MDRLYLKGIQCIGEGKVRSGVMSLATEAIRDEKLSQEVFISNENMVSFLCGVWIQFLLVEVAGVGKDKLKDLAKKLSMKTPDKDSSTRALVKRGDLRRLTPSPLRGSIPGGHGGKHSPALYWSL